MGEGLHEPAAQQPARGTHRWPADVHAQHQVQGMRAGRADRHLGTTARGVRDRLQYRYNDELDALLNELAVDTRSALKQQRAEYKRYQGEKVKAEGKQPQAKPGLDVAALVQTISEPEGNSQPQGSTRSVAVSRENREVTIGPEFICKQCAGMQTPAYYLPGDRFSSYAKGLVKAWVMTLKRIYELHGLEAHFPLDLSSTRTAEQSASNRVSMGWSITCPG